jgi:hypothetical protein
LEALSIEIGSASNFGDLDGGAAKALDERPWRTLSRLISQ